VVYRAIGADSSTRKTRGTTPPPGGGGGGPRLVNGMGRKRGVSRCSPAVDEVAVQEKGSLPMPTAGAPSRPRGRWAPWGGGAPRWPEERGEHRRGPRPGAGRLGKSSTVVGRR